MYSLPTPQRAAHRRAARPLTYPALGTAWMRFQQEQRLRAEMVRRSARLNQFGLFLAASYGVAYVVPSLRHPSVGDQPHVEVLFEILARLRRGAFFVLSLSYARRDLDLAAAEFDAWADQEAADIGLVYVRPNLRRHAVRHVA